MVAVARPVGPRRYRESHALRLVIGEGTNELQRVIIARQPGQRSPA